MPLQLVAHISVVVLQRECENLMGTKELAAQSLAQVCLALPFHCLFTAFSLPFHCPSTALPLPFGQAEADGRPIPTTPRGTTRRGGGGEGAAGPALLELKTEVQNLHGVIAEMAEREERLLRMLQLPDTKPDPVPIKRGDFVRCEDKDKAFLSTAFPCVFHRLKRECFSGGTGRWSTTLRRSTRCCGSCAKRR